VKFPILSSIFRTRMEPAIQMKAFKEKGKWQGESNQLLLGNGDDYGDDEDIRDGEEHLGDLEAHTEKQGVKRGVKQEVKDEKGGDRDGDGDENEVEIEEEDEISWKKSSWVLVKFAFPVMFTFLLEMLPGMVNVIAVGHLSEVHLAAVSLSIMFTSITGISFGFGMATALDTLCSQAWGSSDKMLLGIILQRGLAIEFILSMIVSVIWYFSGDFLSLFKFDPEIIELSSLYVRIFIFGLYPFLVYEVLKKYMQAQGIVYPQMIVAIIGNLWNIFANWLFVFGLNWGYVGAPIARVTTHLFLMLLLLAYSLITKKYKETWGGWSREGLKKWGEFLKLGVPGMAMTCLEGWAFETGAIMAGYLGTTSLATQSVILNVCSFIYMTPFGLSVATSVVVGNAIGGGLPKRAKKLALAGIFLAFCFGLFSTILLVSLKEYIPLIFTRDKDIIALATKILPVVSCFLLIDGLAGVSLGVLRGCGRQLIGSAILFVGYYVIGLPLGGILCFVESLSLGLMGFWIGLACALLVVSALCIVIVIRTDWKKQAGLAKKRLRDQK